VSAEPRPRLVVITDDDRQFVELLTALLSAVPHLRVVGRAANGEEAVTLTETLHPDVVLMDLDMPVVDGFEATARIRELAPDTCVVIISAHEDPARIRAAEEAGAAGFVAKSDVPTELAERVVSICDQHDLLRNVA
jgi:DNA-binding NarL/FixJ family response regulator